jgi:hypothetical protein
MQRGILLTSPGSQRYQICLMFHRSGGDTFKYLFCHFHAFWELKWLAEKTNSMTCVSYEAILISLYSWWREESNNMRFVTKFREIMKLYASEKIRMIKLIHSLKKNLNQLCQNQTCSQSFKIRRSYWGKIFP